MNEMNRHKITLFFGLLVAANLTGIGFDIPILQFISKPLLIPVLMYWLYKNSAGIPGKHLLLTGLFFSWLGDVFLLFEYKISGFFIAGLICFLITHILYIRYFLSIRSENGSLLKKNPALIVAVTGYGIALVYLLFPHLGELTIPVMVYAAVICIMLLCSLHIYHKVNAAAAKSFIFGATLFVISDSVLAVNKFYTVLPLGGVLIMLTYCAAQFFIVKGFLKSSNG